LCNILPNSGQETKHFASTVQYETLNRLSHSV